MATRKELMDEIKVLKERIHDLEDEVESLSLWPENATCHECQKRAHVAVEIFCCMEHVAK